MLPGFLMGGLCLVGESLGIHAAKAFAEGEKEWKKVALICVAKAITA
jgi:hypothetical protein